MLLIIKIFPLWKGHDKDMESLWIPWNKEGTDCLKGNIVNVEEKAEICTEQSTKKSARQSHIISDTPCSTQLASTFMAAD